MKVCAARVYTAKSKIPCPPPLTTRAPVPPARGHQGIDGARHPPHPRREQGRSRRLELPPHHRTGCSGDTLIHIILSAARTNAPYPELEGPRSVLGTFSPNRPSRDKERVFWKVCNFQHWVNCIFLSKTGISCFTMPLNPSHHSPTSVFLYMKLAV